MPTPDNLNAISTATLCLLNGERADAGLRALKQNDKLVKAAVRHSRDMVDQQYFDHIAKNGSDPVARIRAAGYIPSVGSWTVGENLAWGTGSLATPKAIVAAWMKSQGHKENILRASFKEIGLGVVAGNPRSRSGSGATFTTTFGVVTKPRRSATTARTARARGRWVIRARISAPRGGKSPKARASAPRGGKNPTARASAPRGGKSPKARASAPRGGKNPTARASAPRGGKNPKARISAPRGGRDVARFSPDDGN
jgi:cysteine-rich secretory family protein